METVKTMHSITAKPSSVFLAAWSSRTIALLLIVGPIQLADPLEEEADAGQADVWPWDVSTLMWSAPSFFQVGILTI